MMRILGIALAVALAAAIVPQGAPPAEAAKKKAAKKNEPAGRLVNGTFHLGQPLQARTRKGGKRERLTK